MDLTEERKKDLINQAWFIARHENTDKKSVEERNNLFREILKTLESQEKVFFIEQLRNAQEHKKSIEQQPDKSINELHAVAAPPLVETQNADSFVSEDEQTAIQSKESIIIDQEESSFDSFSDSTTPILLYSELFNTQLDEEVAFITDNISLDEESNTSSCDSEDLGFIAIEFPNGLETIEDSNIISPVSGITEFSYRAFQNYSLRETNDQHQSTANASHIFLTSNNLPGAEAGDFTDYTFIEHNK